MTMQRVPYKLWKLIISGIVGSTAQGLLMFLKKQFGILPQFQPFLEIQELFSKIANELASPVFVALASFINGAFVLSYLFGKIYGRLPTDHGLIKGFIFGVFGWLLINLTLFPIVGYGAFVINLGLGALPSAFSFLMIQAYSLSLAFAYSKLIKQKP